MPVIKKFIDGSVIETGQGKFDDWCIYLSRPNIERYAPRDEQYFGRLKELAHVHTSAKIYGDFVKIYEKTKHNIEQSVLDYVTELSIDYENDRTEMDILFTILYLGMLAEQNKKGTRLGKRIKRLGMHQVLVDKYSAKYTASFSRGMKWKDIDAQCKEKGF